MDILKQEQNSAGFLSIQPLRFKNGVSETIDDLVSLEKPYFFSYTCKDGENTWQGDKVLYAYPDKIEDLILGHIVLDCLPCYDSDFSFEIKNENNKYILSLEAKKKEVDTQTKGTLAAVTIDEIPVIMDNFLSCNGKWEGTGCFHRAGLYNPVTKKMIIAEDIGRHNCVDRLKGYTLLNNLKIEDYFLFITARITTSLYKKIRRAGITTIISRSAITSTPYECAIEDNCTLAAFCRPNEKRVTLFHNGMNTITL